MKRTALALLLLATACGHAPAAATRVEPADAGPPPPDPLAVAAELSTETHVLLRAEGELLWTRWITGTGPLPASALAGHPRLAQVESAQLALAAARLRPDDRALQLLSLQLSTLAVSHAAAAEFDALDRARAQLVFPVDGADRGERDLDRLLAEEANGVKRAAIAQAEGKAAATLAPLLLARDAAEERALAAMGVSWAALEERAHGVPVAELSALAERTLAATESVAAQAAAAASVRNLGVTVDRLRRADLPRLVRTAAADAEFAPGKAWPLAQAALAGLLPATVRVDGEPSPSKGARPLALLVDPPADVRLSLRPAGGFDEQRAVLHEAARAAGGAQTAAARWELAQLGDGAAAEGVAQLFESLAGDPEWLRANTALRGEPLDDLVHTEATRRLLGARRAAALLLFEVKRREGPHTADAQAALYRGLLQRATFAALSDDDAQRWPLEAEAWIHTAAQLEGALLAASLEKPSWWKSPDTAATLKQLWAGGRSQPVGVVDPAALAAIASERLSYKAPDAPPPAPKPDYKYMQGDKRRRRKHNKR